MSAEPDRVVEALAGPLTVVVGLLPEVTLLPGACHVSDVEPEQDEGDVDDHRQAGAALVRTFEELGLLSDAQADAWRRRYELAGPTTSPASEEQRAAARRHLATLVDALVPQADRDGEDRAVAPVEGALELLLHVGCVDETELEGWQVRVDDALGRRPRPPAEVAGGTDGVGRGELRAVVPVPLARHDGLCVTSVELSEHQTTIVWHLLRSGPIPIEGVADLGERFTLADDVGTRYDEVVADGSGWSERADGPYAVRGASRSGTAVPAEATELTIARGGATWRVPLPT